MAVSWLLLAGWAFAETAILSSRAGNAPVYPRCLGYAHDVVRFGEPQELYEHVLQVQEALNEPSTFEAVLNATTYMKDR